MNLQKASAATPARRLSIRTLGLSVTIVLTVSSALADDASDAIRQQIAKYTAALDAADIDLAAQVWRTSPEASFIHPAGHAHGWEEIKAIVFGLLRHGTIRFAKEVITKERLRLRSGVLSATMQVRADGTIPV